MSGWDSEDRRRALLRQLRDLDDDLAAGKLDEQDHRRLREPLEREAAAALAAARDRASAAPGGPAEVPATSGGDPDAASDREPGETTVTRRHRTAARRGAGRPAVGSASASRRRRRIVAAVAAAAGVAGVAALLAEAATPRAAGESVSGSAPLAVATASPAPSAGGSAVPAADPSAAGQSLTPEQAATIDAAALDVKAHPKDVGKHLTLAHAYGDAGAGQLAAVEYLAILRLDPANAEANTAMALLAFEVGQTRQAKDMLDQVLRADPRYPEALYVRGLVLLSGLHQPAAATRDLKAYLAVAPYGSHRTAAETLLALAGGRR